MKPHTKSRALLPSSHLAGPALMAVALVMSFLACLALGSVLLVGEAAENWLKRATSQASIQITDTRTQTAKDQLPAVMRVLDATPGIAHARVLTRRERIALLEPWLGRDNIGDDLPIPQLIEITPATPPTLNTDALNVQIRAVAPGARLDTHQQWRQTLQQAEIAIHLFGLLVLIVVSIATAMVILFATRAGLIANQHILDVLHQIGAHNRFISRHFEAHFVKIASYAALGGFVAACLFFYLLGALIDTARAPGFLLTLLIVPLAAILLTWSVTRFYVLRNLRHYN